MSKVHFTEDVETLRKGFNESLSMPVGVQSSYTQAIEANAGYEGPNELGQIAFDVYNTTAHVLDLSKSYIATQFSITHTTDVAGNAIAEDEPICLAQNAGARMFQRCQVYLNDVEISDQCAGSSEGLQHWASWFRTVTTQSAPFGQNVALRSCVLYPAANVRLIPRTAAGTDAPPGANVPGDAVTGDLFQNEFMIDQTHSDLYSIALSKVSRNTVTGLGDHDFMPRTSPGAAARQRPIIGGSVATLVYRPSAAIFHTHRYLPPGQRLRIVLTKAPVNQWVMYKQGPGAAALRIASAQVNYAKSRFYLRRIELDKLTLSTVMDYLTNPQVGYVIPLQACRGVTFDIPTGTVTFNRNGVLSGPSCDSVFIAISRNALGTPLISPYGTGPGNRIAVVDAGTGAITASADAQPFISELYVRVAGEKFPKDGYVATQAVGNDSDLFSIYEAYLRACNVDFIDGDRMPMLSYMQFRKNYTFFPISLRKDGSFKATYSLSDSTVSAATSQGLEVYVRFGAATTQALTCVVISMGGAFIRLNSSGGVDRVNL